MLPSYFSTDAGRNLGGDLTSRREGLKARHLPPSGTASQRSCRPRCSFRDDEEDDDDGSSWSGAWPPGWRSRLRSCLGAGDLESPHPPVVMIIMLVVVVSVMATSPAILVTVIVPMSTGKLSISGITL